MKSRLYALCLSFAFALAQAPAASAQSNAAAALSPSAWARTSAAWAPRQRAAASDWSAVQALSPGRKIIVRTKDGDRLSGRFDSANDLLLNFTDGRKKISLRRESVRLVQLDRGNSRMKGMLFGMAVGAAAGFALGSVLYFPAKDDMVGAVVPVSAVLGAGIGTGIGAATGKGNKNETVYEAP